MKIIVSVAFFAMLIGCSEKNKDLHCPSGATPDSTYVYRSSLSEIIFLTGNVYIGNNGQNLYYKNLSSSSSVTRTFKYLNSIANKKGFTKFKTRGNISGILVKCDKVKYIHIYDIDIGDNKISEFSRDDFDSIRRRLSN